MLTLVKQFQGIFLNCRVLKQELCVQLSPGEKNKITIVFRKSWEKSNKFSVDKNMVSQVLLTNFAQYLI